MKTKTPMFKIEVNCYATMNGQYRWFVHCCDEGGEWRICSAGLEDTIEDAFKAAYHVQWMFDHNPHVDDRKP